MKILMLLCLIPVYGNVFQPQKSELTPRNVNISMGEINTKYQNVISKYNEFHYVYQYPVNKRKTLKLDTKILPRYADVDHPLRISVRFERGSQGWQIPFKEGNNKLPIYQVEKTLCLFDVEDFTELTVVISTSSLNDIQFEVTMEEVDDFFIRVNNGLIHQVKDLSIASTTFKRVDLTSINGLVQIKVTSEQDSCGLVSVQPMMCPVAGTAADIYGSGSWQSMLKLAAFTVHADDYPEGFFLSFLTLEDDKVCGNETLVRGNRNKTFDYQVINPVTGMDIILEILLTIAVTVSASIISLCLGWCYLYPRRVSREISPDEIDHRRDTIQDNYTRPETKGPKYVSELSTREDQNRDKTLRQMFKIVFKQNDLYVWLVLMMFIFYGLPAIQLVFKYQDVLRGTGNNDLCYYNFLCTVPTGKVQDFGHILSNIAYIAFGFTYLTLIGLRKHFYVKKVERERSIINESGSYIARGVPQHFGIFYALGFALVFEGVLSATYHVCPTGENFQFDTTFMYLLALLGFIKIYQFRHPDASSNAYKAFFGIALVMFLEVLGIYMNNTAYWIFLLLLYLSAIILLTSVLYHPGKWSLSHMTPIWLFQSMYGKVKDPKSFAQNVSKKRSTFILIIDFINIGFIIYGAVTQPNISSYFLFIFIGNLMVYFLYYVSLKLIHKEKIPYQAYIISILALICWIPALYFFVSKKTSSNLSPAASRNLNEDCVLGDLFDVHDVWHFLSGAGLFLSFALLIILDDGIAQVPRNKIVVF